MPRCEGRRVDEEGFETSKSDGKGEATPSESGNRPIRRTYMKVEENLQGEKKGKSLDPQGERRDLKGPWGT